MSAPVLVTRNLSFSYGAEPVFHDVNLSISPGEVVGIIGPNGGGKSTLLRCLAGLEREPMTGTIELTGADINGLSRRDVAQRVAFVSQEAAIPFGFTVSEVVTMGRHPYRGRLAGLTEEDRSTVETALRRTAVEDLRDRPLNTLSGGERQRVAIARALAQQPQVLLLDEPASHLDMKHRVRLHELLSRLHERDGLAIVLVTHDLASAADQCDRVAILAEGTLLGVGTPADILRPTNIERAFGVAVVMARNPVTGRDYPFPSPGGEG